MFCRVECLDMTEVREKESVSVKKKEKFKEFLILLIKIHVFSKLNSVTWLLTIPMNQFYLISIGSIKKKISVSVMQRHNGRFCGKQKGRQINLIKKFIK